MINFTLKKTGWTRFFPLMPRILEILELLRSI